MNKFLTSNKASYKLLRTIVQAILGFIVNNLAMLVAQTNFDASTQAIIVTVTMAVLAPVMDKLGVKDEKARDANA